MRGKGLRQEREGERERGRDRREERQITLRMFENAIEKHFVSLNTYITYMYIYVYSHTERYPYILVL